MLEERGIVSEYSRVLRRLGDEEQGMDDQESLGELCDGLNLHRFLKQIHLPQEASFRGESNCTMPRCWGYQVCIAHAL